ncbi:EAL domain, c-di-GMP-specific phosphodiesterase class I (or its enzymatically inactive variant) [Lachnospiraceae bacterium]|nr:EAL domain, c-di-GMP-specific phosphodiesterase class I (or its enzymatically inactive variant) [Lachnospiraceae bacterium]
MFTWNFQLISKARLAETLGQLKLDTSRGDVLVRIHTASHLPDEAVDLAQYIKRIIPGARIFGTSTSAIILNGKLIPNQCLISVTQMSTGSIRTARLSNYDVEKGETVAADKLTSDVKAMVFGPDTKFLLTFITVNYHDVYDFVEECNKEFPNVKMMGGLADGANSNLEELPKNTFVFDEKGWTDKGIIVASIGGNDVDTCCSYATGVEAIGDDMEVTETYANTVLTINNKSAAAEYRKGIGDEISAHPELSSLFPYVCSDAPEFPVFFHYIKNIRLSDIYPESDPNNKAFYDTHPDIDKDQEMEIINSNFHITPGRKVKRAFIYDRKIISDNRSMFRKMESFEKSETIFAYSCIVRSIIYSNCVKWELSAYENSNMGGCITYGEILNDDGRNRFVNGTFTVTAMGEKPANQEFNPYTFLYTESLADDNEELLNYLTFVEMNLEQNEEMSSAESMRSFVRDCEYKLLYADKYGIPNVAALNIDMKLKGIDRLCIIDVSDTTSMKSVFSEQLIQLTFKNYLSKCEKFAQTRNYHMYMIQNWRVAIAAESYMVSLSQFAEDMEELQRILFENTEDFIAIVPYFSVLDNCTNENYNNAFNSSRVRMWQKNMQFIVCDATDNQLDEDAIRDKYHLVNVVNYAIANNKVIPQYQGIYDNNSGSIHHYEALMRIEDENGKMYYPNSFLEVARAYGLLYDGLSMQMIKKVFDKFKDSKNNSVSVNLGMRDIRNKEITDFLYDFLSVAKYPENFIFELLENEDIDDYHLMVEFVDKIHELGAKIAIDDFGSGFSNLQHIINLQSDIVKIDGSIIKNCCINSGAENLIALISAWKGLTGSAIDIIAEYVENEEIQNKLMSYSIDYSQGYYFAEPVTDISIS